MVLMDGLAGDVLKVRYVLVITSSSKRRRGKRARGMLIHTDPHTRTHTYTHCIWKKSNHRRRGRETGGGSGIGPGRIRLSANLKLTCLSAKNLTGNVYFKKIF